MNVDAGEEGRWYAHYCVDIPFLSITALPPPPAPQVHRSPDIHPPKYCVSMCMGEHGRQQQQPAVGYSKRFESSLKQEMQKRTAAVIVAVGTILIFPSRGIPQSKPISIPETRLKFLRQDPSISLKYPLHHHYIWHFVAHMRHALGLQFSRTANTRIWQRWPTKSILPPSCRCFARNFLHFLRLSKTDVSPASKS